MPAAGRRRIVHLLSGLEVGGKERVVLQLARRALGDGMEPRLLLFDAPYRGPDLDLDPGSLPVHFLRRGPGVNLGFAAAVARFVRERGTEVLHAHNDTAIFYACAASALTPRRRLFVCGTFHTQPGHATRGARFLTRLASRRADRVTSVSSDLAARVVKDGWVRRCETILNGVELEDFTPEGPTGGWRERLQIPDGSIVVGQVGRFDPVSCRQR
jgi:hypothetical protein